MPRLSTIVRVATLLLALLVAGIANAAEPVTFSETIAPIVYAHCVQCHRAGEAAPFPLVTYDDVRRRGSLIAAVTGRRYMPPWHATGQEGEFAADRRLTDAQIAAIADWVKAGMPQGDAAKMPALPTFTNGWQLGTPDLVLEMPVGFDVPASGRDIFRNFAIPTGLTEDKWVRAIEFRPSARSVVHHALFQYVRAGATKDLKAGDGQPGFDGLAPVGFLNPAMGPAGQLGGWAVGNTPTFLAGNLAMPLAKNSDFVLQLHLHPTGKAETERSTIGLYFADRPPEKRLWNIGVPGFFGALAGIDIPPGEKAFTITGTWQAPVDMQVYSVAAHAHYLGKEMLAVATLPDGTTRQLLWIRDWDFNWQDRYDFMTPIALPKGSRVNVRISFDNTSENPRNPSRPPRRVRFGGESLDEMGGIQFQMVTTEKSDEAVLQQIGAAALRAALLRLQTQFLQRP